jgi:hypothetical protein
MSLRCNNVLQIKVLRKFASSSFFILIILETGIKTLDGLKPSSQLRLKMMGIKRTTTGVLLIKAEAVPTITRIKNMDRVGLPREYPLTF